MSQRRLIIAGFVILLVAVAASGWIGLRATSEAHKAARANEIANARSAIATCQQVELVKTQIRAVLEHFRLGTARFAAIDCAALPAHAVLAHPGN